MCDLPKTTFHQFPQTKPVSKWENLKEGDSERTVIRAAIPYGQVKELIFTDNKVTDS